MPVRSGVPVGGLYVELPPWQDYTWIAVFGGFACFWSGWSIGANNLANAFGTSVGAKTFTMFQACMVGTVMEFVGAMALGNSVTDIIAGSIARPSFFQANPELYMYGMLCAILGASLWVTIATYFELGCSTTHSIIGAVLAVSLVWGGPGAVVWADPVQGFPYYKGFIPVVISWFIAPASAALVAAVIFIFNRNMILRRDNSTVLAFWALPGLVFLTVIVDMLLILYRGAGTKLSWTIQTCAWVSVCIGAGTAFFTIIIIMPMLWMKLRIHLMRSIHREAGDSTMPKPSELKHRLGHDHTVPVLGKSVLLGPDGKFVSLSSPNQNATRDDSRPIVKLREDEEVAGSLDHLVSVKEWYGETKDFLNQTARPLFASFFKPKKANLNEAAVQGEAGHQDRPSVILELATVYEEHSNRSGTANAEDAPPPDPTTTNQSSPQFGAEGTLHMALSSAPTFGRVTFEEEVNKGPSLNSSQGTKFDNPSYRSSHKTDQTDHTDLTTFEGVQVYGVWDKVYAAKDASQEEEQLPTFKERTRTTLVSWMMAVKVALLHGVTKDIHADLEDNEQLVAMHQGAEIFEPKTEYVYKYLQMFSAASVSFVHGAKDSANAAGPYSAIWYVYNNLAMPTSGSTNCPTWILALAALGIVIGLNTYGYKMIRVLGVKLSKMTPSRGYSAELSVALVVSFFTYFQLAISTTHCIFGAEIGVGMCESLSHGTNWALFARTLTSWIFTVFISGSFAALFFSAGGYAPSIVQSRQIDLYESYALALTQANWALLNFTNTHTNGTYNQSLNQIIKQQMAIINALYGYVAPQTYGQLVNDSQALLLANSFTDPGFNVSNPIFGRYSNVTNVSFLANPAPALRP